MSTVEWGEWREMEPPEMYLRSPIEHERNVRVMQNERYEVHVIELPSGITYLSAKRRKKEHVHDWRELLRVKNELTHPHREAFEMYPGMFRVVDESNQYHIFVLPLGIGLNVGYLEGVIDDAVPDRFESGQARQRPLPKWMSRVERTGGWRAQFATGEDAEGNVALLADFREFLPAELKEILK